MPNNPLQLSQLITRLWEKTQAGQIDWEQLSERTKYQARQGNFVIILSGSIGGGLVTTSAHIEIRRLDGNVVAQAGVGLMQTLTMTTAFGSPDQLTPNAEHALKLLFQFLSDRSTDLDELLRVLG